MASQPPPSQAQSHPYSTPTPDPRQPTPSGHHPSQQPPSDPYGGRRPQSTYNNPQELGAYPSSDRPVSYHSGIQPQPQQVQHLAGKETNEYSPSVYSPEDGVPAATGPHDSVMPTSYPPQPPHQQVGVPPGGLPPSLQAQGPPQPSYSTHPQYGASQSYLPAKSPSPAPSAAPYPNLGSAQPVYQAYQPPGGAGGAEGYYR
jgi:hypothetical protein